MGEDMVGRADSGSESYKLEDDIEREIESALEGKSVFDFLEEKKGEDLVKRTHKGKIIGFYGEDVFVDIGRKDQGVVPLKQFEDKEPKVGDVIDVIIDEYDPIEGLVYLSLPGAVKDADWNSIEAGQIVEGVVIGLNRGGLKLKLGKEIFAFMPASQIELHYVDNLKPYLNKKLRCKVVRVDRFAKEVLVSRREILEEQVREEKKRFIDSLAIGKVVEGTVTRILPYGAFVEIGPIEGLLHISEMSYKRIKDPKDVVQIGQKLKVMIIDVDKDKEKVSLSLKQVVPDPWEDIENKCSVGDIVTGRISNVFDFGAFVEIEEGVEGLIPRSEISYERNVNPRAALKVGQIVKVKVLEINGKEKKIVFSLKQTEDDPWIGASVRWPVGAVVKGTVSSITDFGVFVQIAPGVEGLVHISEVSDKNIKTAEGLLSVGEEVDVKVLGVEEEKRRMSLSIRQVKSEGIEEIPNLPRSGSGEKSGRKKKKKQLKGGLD